MIQKALCPMVPEQKNCVNSKNSETIRTDSTIGEEIGKYNKRVKNVLLDIHIARK